VTPAIARQLHQMAEEAGTIGEGYLAERWSLRVKTFIARTLGADEAATFGALGFSTFGPGSWPETLAIQQGHLEGLVANAETATQNKSEGVPSSRTLANNRTNREKCL
jgi:hypothetical protein